MFGSKFYFFIPGILVLWSAAGCIGVADEDAMSGKHANSAPVPHKQNILAGRLYMDGNQPSLRLCSDTFLLALDTTDEKVLELLNNTKEGGRTAGNWYVELDGRTELFELADSMPSRYSSRILLYELLTVRLDTNSSNCR